MSNFILRLHRPSLRESTLSATAVNQKAHQVVASGSQVSVSKYCVSISSCSVSESLAVASLESLTHAPDSSFVLMHDNSVLSVNSFEIPIEPLTTNVKAIFPLVDIAELSRRTNRIRILTTN